MVGFGFGLCACAVCSLFWTDGGFGIFGARWGRGAEGGVGIFLGFEAWVWRIRIEFTCFRISGIRYRMPTAWLMSLNRRCSHRQAS